MELTHTALPEGFLTKPGPEVIREKIHFEETSLPEYASLYAVVLDNVLTPDECKQLIHAAEAQMGGKWEQAMVNIGNDQQELRTDIRDCGRIIWDDRTVVEKIWNRVKAHVPELEVLKGEPLVSGNGPVKRKETWQMSRLNERMRFLKYGPGQYFRHHCDGTYQTPDKSEMSFYTLHLYLNESDPTGPDGEMIGGATTFHSETSDDDKLDVKPKTGRVLIFQHRYLLHSGEELAAGLKYTLRTDLMFRKAATRQKFDNIKESPFRNE